MKFTARFKVVREYSVEIDTPTQAGAEKIAEKMAADGGFCEGTLKTVSGCEEEEITVLEVNPE